MQRKVKLHSVQIRAAECRTGCMSAHECENARNHVAVSGLANTLHPVLFYELEKHHFSVSLSCELASFFVGIYFSRQKGRNLVCGVENGEFYVLFCFVHLSS